MIEAIVMVKLTFFGGVNEIGGNKILLQDKKTSILLDFGQSFTFGTNYYFGYLTPELSMVLATT